MGNKITICHFNEGGSWDSLELPPDALEGQGHQNHELDIWPPSSETPGHNWPQGEAIYLNGCVMTIHPEPSPSPSPTSSLPESGGGLILVPISLALIAAGLALRRRADSYR